MTILVIGAGGYLGGEVARQASISSASAVDGSVAVSPAAWRGEVVGTATTERDGHLRLDITDPAATLLTIKHVRPELIVNAAARQNSWAACADGAANVALAARAVRARLVHISSDAVHAGRPEPYGDGENPTPIYPYGAAKAAGETAVAAIDPGAAIVRTSLIIGDDRSKHIRLTLDLIEGRRPGALFTDEYRRPIAVQDLAAAILELAASPYAGLINVTGPETLTRADLGRLVARRYGLDPARVPVCPIAEGGLGPRPGHVLLDSSRATALLDTRLRPATESIVGG